MTRLEHAFEENVAEPIPWDRLLHASIGRMTGGISPTALHKKALRLIAQVSR